MGWIYQLDRKSGFLLWCSANGKPPPGVGFGDDESEFGLNDADGSVSVTTTATATASSSCSAAKKLKYSEMNREIKCLEDSRSKIQKSQEKIDNVVSSLR